jgi:hypothetical protein
MSPDDTHRIAKRSQSEPLEKTADIYNTNQTEIDRKIFKAPKNFLFDI